MQRKFLLLFFGVMCHLIAIAQAGGELRLVKENDEWKVYGDPGGLPYRSLQRLSGCYEILVLESASAPLILPDNLGKLIYDNSSQMEDAVLPLNNRLQLYIRSQAHQINGSKTITVKAVPNWNTLANVKHISSTK